MYLSIWKKVIICASIGGTAVITPAIVVPFLTEKTKKTKKEIVFKYQIPTIRQMNLEEITNRPEVIDSILKIDKNLPKEKAIKKIGKILEKAPKYKKIYLDFVKNQNSWKTAYFLLKYVFLMTDNKIIEKGIKFLNPKKYQYENKTGQIKFLRNKILSQKVSTLNISQKIKNIINGKDDDFNELILQYLLKINNKKFNMEENINFKQDEKTLEIINVVKFILS